MSLIDRSAKMAEVARSEVGRLRVDDNSFWCAAAPVKTANM